MAVYPSSPGSGHLAGISLLTCIPEGAHSHRRIVIAKLFKMEPLPRAVAHSGLSATP